jgi:hypothetical protein
LNAGDADAHVAITIFFGPQSGRPLPRNGRRPSHPAPEVQLSFRPATDIARTDYASVFESDVPIVVQHTRMDSGHAEMARLSTVAYSEG